MPVDAIPAIGPLPTVETPPSAPAAVANGAFSRELHGGAKNNAGGRDSRDQTPSDKTVDRPAPAAKKGPGDSRRTSRDRTQTQSAGQEHCDSTSRGDDQSNDENTAISAKNDVSEPAPAEDDHDAEKDVGDETLLASDPTATPLVAPVVAPLPIEDVAAQAEGSDATSEVAAIPANAQQQAVAQTAADLDAALADQGDESLAVGNDSGSDPATIAVAPVAAVLPVTEAPESITAAAATEQSKEPELKPHFLGAKESDDEKSDQQDPKSDQARIQAALKPAVEHATQGDLSQLVGRMQQAAGDSDGETTTVEATQAMDGITDAVQQNALVELSKDADKKDDTDPGGNQDSDKLVPKTDDVPAQLTAHHSQSPTASRFHSILGGHESQSATQARPPEVDTARFLQRVTRAFQHAEARGGEEIRLRLSPPELGSLQLEVSMKAGVLTARLETETSAAQAVLLENLPQLKERLAEQGMHIERFDVNVSGRNPGGTPNSPQDNPDRRDPNLRPLEAIRQPSAISGSPRRSDGTFDGEGLNVIV